MLSTLSEKSKSNTTTEMKLIEESVANSNKLQEETPSIINNIIQPIIFKSKQTNINHLMDKRRNNKVFQSMEGKIKIPKRNQYINGSLVQNKRNKNLVQSFKEKEIKFATKMGNQGSSDCISMEGDILIRFSFHLSF